MGVSRPLRLLAAGAAAILALVAAPSSQAAAPPSAQAAAPPSTQAAAGALPRINLAMDGRSIHLSGALTSGAVQVVIDVTRLRQAEPVFLRLYGRATYAQVLAAGRRHHGNPDALAPYGRIVFAPEALRGRSVVQVALAPGRYVAVDVTTPDPRRLPHTFFTIAPSQNPAPLPKPAATVGATEFHFSGPSTLHDGQLVRFENDGFLVHMILAARFRTAAAAQVAAALLRQGRDRDAGALVIGSFRLLNVASGGTRQQQVLNLTPGYYVLACLTLTDDGREETLLGMVRPIRVLAH
jgi:hypothetical protein